MKPMKLKALPREEWWSFECWVGEMTVETYADEHGKKVLCCPECKGEPEVKWRNGWSVSCKCGVRMFGFRRKRSALRRWNRFALRASIGLVF